MECQFCGKECKNKNSLAQHEVRCGLNPNKKVSSLVEYHKIKSGPWNKGKDKLNDERVKQAASKISSSMKIHHQENPFSDQTRAKLGQRAKENGFGGYRRNGGRGKKGWYFGVWCDSSWELAWVIYAKDQNINFIRNTKKFRYEFDGKSRNYIPDFYLVDENMYVEVKGYSSQQFEAKKRDFPHKLQVLEREEMKPIIQFVEQRYGKDFVRLYTES